MKREQASITTVPTTAIAGIVARQPTTAMSPAATGGTTRLPVAPPDDATPTAVPRRRTNQRTTVALHGTHVALMPTAATTPSVRYTCQSA
jgi:hypothetical protein